MTLPIVASIREDTEMADPSAPPPLHQIATFESNRAKARFGVAYVRAVCSQAGVGFSETPIDEDVLAIDGKVDFAEAPVMVQIKCTGQYRIDGGHTATWPADVKWREKWKKCRLPVYFVLVMVDPDEQARWLEHDLTGTFLRAAAFWVRVDQESEGSGITVPKSQRLTANTLREWFSDMDASFAPARGGDQGVGV